MRQNLTPAGQLLPLPPLRLWAFSFHLGCLSWSFGPLSDFGTWSNRPSSPEQTKGKGAKSMEGTLDCQHASSGIHIGGLANSNPFSQGLPRVTVMILQVAAVGYSNLVSLSSSCREWSWLLYHILQLLSKLFSRGCWPSIVAPSVRVVAT